MPYAARKTRVRLAVAQWAQTAAKLEVSFFLENTNSVDFISIYDLYVTAVSSRSVQGRQAKVTNNDTIRYDTRCYFNVRSKADMSQLNLPHGQVA